MLPCCCSLISSVSTCSCSCFIFVLTFVVPAFPTFFFHSSHHFRLTFFSLQLTAHHLQAIHSFPSRCTGTSDISVAIGVSTFLLYPWFCACMHTVVSKCEKTRGPRSSIHHRCSPVLLAARFGRGVASPGGFSGALRTHSTHCFAVAWGAWSSPQKKCVRLKEAFGVQTVCCLKRVRRERVAPS